jgi:hypothetical protein
MPQIFIVHDTNVLLSETAYSKSIPEKIVSVWRYGNLNVILYQYILDELQRVLPKLIHRLGCSSLKIRDFVGTSALYPIVIQTKYWLLHGNLRELDAGWIIGFYIAKFGPRGQEKHVPSTGLQKSR